MFLFVFGFVVVVVVVVVVVFLEYGMNTQVTLLRREVVHLSEATITLRRNWKAQPPVCCWSSDF